ncbi:MAG: hypothetical protein JWM02_1030 [Frankiales bacterium]|nr:hypothetical protein [Frankiales bacterium]
MTPYRLETPLAPMALLESGIPLSLLLDIACGPQSADLLSHEQAAEYDDDCAQASRWAG